MNTNNVRLLIQKQTFDGVDYTLITIYDAQSNDDSPIYKFMREQVEGKQNFRYLATNMSALEEVEKKSNAFTIISEAYEQIEELIEGHEFSTQPQFFGLIYCPIHSLFIELQSSAIPILSKLEEFRVKKEFEITEVIRYFQRLRVTT